MLTKLFTEEVVVTVVLVVTLSPFPRAVGSTTSSAEASRPDEAARTATAVARPKKRMVGVDPAESTTKTD